MSTLADGTGECDNCGHTEENAGIVNFLMVADLNPAKPGTVENLHFCRKNKCDRKIRRAAVLTRYTQRNESSE